MRTRVALLISGNGSNLQGLLDQQSMYDVRLVISSKASAYGLRRARRFGAPVLIIPKELKKEAMDDWVDKTLQKFRIEAIALAGFMRVLGKDFVNRWHGKIINIHPSLLPLYPGLRGYESALGAGERYAGATVHHVVEEVDAGEILVQRKFLVPMNRPVEHQRLALHIVEQKAYFEGLRKFLCQKHIQHWF